MGPLGRFWRSTIGKKIVMAVTGLVMIGFLVTHVAANLLVFSGPEGINGYAASLRELGPLLWVARGILLAALVLHVMAALQLTRRSQRLGRDGILNTEDDMRILDLSQALSTLGIATSTPGSFSSLLSVDSSTRRILVKVQVGDLERQTAAVVRGAMGTGMTAILWMGER